MFSPPLTGTSTRSINQSIYHGCISHQNQQIKKKSIDYLSISVHTSAKDRSWMVECSQTNHVADKIYQSINQSSKESNNQLLEYPSMCPQRIGVGWLSAPIRANQSWLQIPPVDLCPNRVHQVLKRVKCWTN